MTSRRPLLAKLAGILLLLLGVLRSLGGLALLLQGTRAAPDAVAPPESIRLVGFLVAGVGLLVVFAGIWVLQRRRWSWILAQIALVIFVLGGFWSSRLLFRSPKLLTTVGDILVALVIFAALGWAQRDEGESGD